MRRLLLMDLVMVEQVGPQKVPALFVFGLAVMFP